MPKQVAFALLACTLAAAPASADSPYGNVRFGFFITIPSAISFDRNDSDNGDGATFYAKDHAVQLAAWGHWLMEADLAATAAQSVQSEKDDGWTVTYSGGEGSRFAVYSGSKAGRIMYERLIPTCKGGAVAHYRIEYPAARKAEYDDVIKGLNASFKPGIGPCGQ